MQEKGFDPEQEQQMLHEKLTRSGAISQEKFHAAVQEAAGKGIPLSRHLVESGAVEKSVLYETLAENYGVSYIDVSTFNISQDAVKAVSADLAHRYRCVPLFKIGDTLSLAMENPLDLAAIDHLRRASQCEIDPCLGAPGDIETALTENYGASNAVENLIERLSGKTPPSEAGDAGVKAPSWRQTKGPKLGAAADENAVIELEDLILRQAYEEGASDIHVEPDEDCLKIRYRVDGILQEAPSPPKRLEQKIISRIKILAEMDIAESRRPQDGKIKARFQDKDVDIRVSAMPTVDG